MQRQRAETHGTIVGIGLVGELLEVADVNQQLGRREPHVECREQALPAGNRHGAAIVLSQDTVGLIEGRRPDIAEVTSLHASRLTAGQDRAR